MGTSALHSLTTSSLGRAGLPVLELLDCVTCGAAGHRCKSTHTNDAGQPVCVFCLDGVPCPLTKRKPGRPLAPPRKETTRMTTKVVTVDDLSTRKCPAPKRPKDPNSPVCNAQVRRHNKTGLCSRHYYLSKLKHPPVAVGAATASRVPRVNGNHHRSPTKPSNGRTSLIQLNLTEGQLNDFFLSLFEAERALIVNIYHAGGR